MVSHIRNVSISENSLFNLGRRSQYLQTNAYLSEACFCFFKVSPRRRRGEDGKLLRIVGHLVYWCLQFMIFYIYTLHTYYIMLYVYHFTIFLFQLFSLVIDFQHPGCTQHRIQWVWSTQDAIVEDVAGFFEIFLAPTELLLRWITGNTSPILAGLERFKVDYVDCEKSYDLHIST